MIRRTLAVGSFPALLLACDVIGDDRSDAEWRDGLPRWTLQSMPIVQIGGPDSEVPLYQADIAELLSDGGSFIIANGGTAEILKVATNGRVLARAGGRGSGPGEFRVLTLDVDRVTDEIWALDRRSMRLTIFDGDLNLLETITAPEVVQGSRFIGASGGIAYFARGGFLDVVEQTPVPPLTPIVVDRRGVSTIKGEFAVPLGINASWDFTPKSGVTAGLSGGAYPGVKQVLLADGVAIVDGRVGQVVFPDGDSIGIDAGCSTESLSPDAVEEAVAEHWSAMTWRNGEQTPDHVVDSIVGYVRQSIGGSVFSDALGAGDGTIWLRCLGGFDDPEAYWSIYDPVARRVIGGAVLSTQFKLLDVGRGGRVLLGNRDELGVEFVSLYDLVKVDGGHEPN